MTDHFYLEPKPPTDSASERDNEAASAAIYPEAYAVKFKDVIVMGPRVAAAIAYARAEGRAAGYAAGQEAMREENARLLNLIRIMFPVNEAAIEHRDKHGSNDCWLCRKVNKYEEAIRALPVEGEQP